jgi:hypothetical protein
MLCCRARRSIARWSFREPSTPATQETRERSVRTFVRSFLCRSLSARSHDIAYDIGLDMTHRSASARARLLRVCVADQKQTRTSEEPTESRRARLEREHLSRDIATTSPRACGPAPAISINAAATRQAGFHQNPTAMAWERRNKPRSRQL